MLLQTIKLIGTEKDETAVGIATIFNVKVFLWDGKERTGSTIQIATTFGVFPEVIFDDPAGIEVTHATIGARRSRPDVKQGGFVQFIDVSGAKRKVIIPEGEINGITFGVLLLTSAKLPVSLPLPQLIIDIGKFAVPPVLQAPNGDV